MSLYDYSDIIEEIIYNCLQKQKKKKLNWNIYTMKMVAEQHT